MGRHCAVAAALLAAMLCGAGRGVPAEDRVKGWGSNYNGELGDGKGGRITVASRVLGISSVSKVAAGEQHSLALKSDGTVWALGANWYGQLGDGTNTDRNAPVQVSGLSGVAAIAAGYYHSLALKSDGTVWAWGYNDDGQLGDGTQDDRAVPARVSMIFGVSKIAAGYNHSLAIAGGNYAPAITSGPAAAPNPAEVGQAVAFGVTASDADGDALTYTWNFGDGTAVSTERNPTHSFAAAGVYTVTVTVSDGVANTLGTVDVLVTESGQAALGVSKLAVARSFVGMRGVSIKTSGTFFAPAGEAVEGAGVALDVGGAVVSGTMDAKGRIKTDVFRFGLKAARNGDGTLAGGEAKYKAAGLVSGYVYGDELDAAGLTAGAVDGANVDLPVGLSAWGYDYAASCSGFWKSNALKGRFKGPVK